MALRFRKSVKLAPGIRMNFGGSGLSWTVGPRGASVNMGKRGTYVNYGIPGTGISARQALSPGASPNARPPALSAPPTTTRVSLTVAVSDDGLITFKDQNGDPVSDHLITQAKKQQGDAIRALIQSKCDQINEQLTALGTLHHDTPPPSLAPSYCPAPYAVERPRPPVPKVPGFFAKMFRGAAIAAENAKAHARYEAAVRDWEAKLSAFQSEEEAKQNLVVRAVAGEVEAMERFFGEVLMDIVWPRETLVSFEFREAGKCLYFDVDLPEVEDLPTKTASVPQRGYKLTLKELAATAVQKMYAQHVHSIAFRLIGEAFAALPNVQAVTLSGFSQRKNKATGHEADEYLLSIVVPRDRWQGLNFGDLPAIDVVEALGQFQLRRTMSKSGVLSPIEPF